MPAIYDDPLETPVQFVPGVGPERAPLLHRLGLATVEDLLFYVPRSVLDLSAVCAIPDLQTDVAQTIRGTIVDHDSRNISHGRTMQTVLVESDGDHLKCVWFNQPWVLKKLLAGQCVLFSGKPKRRSGRWEMSHPRLQTIEIDDPAAVGEVLPRYGLTDGIRMDAMRRIIRNAVLHYDEFVVEYLPAAFREDHGLVTRGEAVRQLHCPDTAQQFDSARHRLVFDDLLEFQLGLALRRRAWQRNERAVQLTTTTKIDARIRRLFAFDFTKGQNGAIEDIVADLNSGHAMHRLLQADVGAGKT
ncbi:MAG: OB-fold nucleic acid binding domain-containing protein, partial [Planctomycetaceae bacterium]